MSLFGNFDAWAAPLEPMEERNYQIELEPARATLPPIETLLPVEFPSTVNVNVNAAENVYYEQQQQQQQQQQHYQPYEPVNYAFMNNDNFYNACTVNFHQLWNHYQQPDDGHLICQLRLSVGLDGITRRNELVFKKDLPFSPQNAYQTPYVEYVIRRHDIWGLALTFSLHGLPPNYDSSNIDNVIQLLAPHDGGASLRGGGVGGMGVLHLTDQFGQPPVWMIDPCGFLDLSDEFGWNTGSFTVENLLFFISTFGRAIGLNVPSRIANGIREAFYAHISNLQNGPGPGPGPGPSSGFGSSFPGASGAGSYPPPGGSGSGDTAPSGNFAGGPSGDGNSVARNDSDFLPTNFLPLASQATHTEGGRNGSGRKRRVSGPQKTFTGYRDMNARMNQPSASGMANGAHPSRSNNLQFMASTPAEVQISAPVVKMLSNPVPMSIRERRRRVNAVGPASKIGKMAMKRSKQKRDQRLRLLSREARVQGAPPGHSDDHVDAQLGCSTSSSSSPDISASRPCCDCVPEKGNVCSHCWDIFTTLEDATCPDDEEARIKDIPQDETVPWSKDFQNADHIDYSAELCESWA